MKRQEKGRGKLDIRVLFTLAAIAEILGTLLIATLLTALLEDLGVAPETAAEDACKMEHVISDESFAALKQLKKRLCEEAK